MKSANRWMKVLAAAALAAGMAISAARGETATVDGVTWTYSVVRDGVLVEGANPAKGKLVIPSSLGGYPVTGLNAGAFSGCSGLTSVTIPDGVTTVGRHAFSGCSGMTSVTIPDSVTAFDQYVFSGCSGLTSVAIPYGDFSVKLRMFAGCVKLTSVTLPESVRRIGMWAFDGCVSLAAVKIPESVTEIDVGAFSGCGLTALTIPARVDTIECGAFSRCGDMTNIAVAAGNSRFSSMNGVLFAKDGVELHSCPGGKTGAYAIPSGVASVLDCAFRGCSKLTSLTIPSGVACIGVYAFEDCSGLTSLTIPASVTDIGLSFDGHKDEASPFHGCGALAGIHVEADNGCYSSKDGVLFTKSGEGLLCCPPKGRTGAYAVPPGVTGIGSMAFADCGGLTTIAMPDSVTRIGSGAFSGCGALTALTLPPGVTNLESSLFSDCRALATLTIPESVTDIGSGVFEGCSGLKTLYAPEAWESKYVGGKFWSAFAQVPEGCRVVYGTPRLALGASERTFTADAADGNELGVTANVAWTATSSSAWLTVGTASGDGNGTIVYGVAANSGAARTGTITVVGGGLTRTFTVTQEGFEARLELGAGERTFTAAAASNKELPVTANVAWTAKSSATWLTVKTAGGTGNGSIVYDVAANAGTASRTGTIAVAGGGLARTFTVKQDGKTVTLELGAGERTFTAAAANNKELPVTANVAWTAKASAGWLTVKTASGTGSGKIVYNVAANAGTASRTGTITVVGGGLTRTFTVTQEGQGIPETQETPVRVPHDWLEGNAGAILAANGNDFEAAAKATAANGRAVWECYVADVPVTETGVDFKTTLVREDGQWVPKPIPDRGGARKYTVQGSSAIGDEASWGPVTEDSLFFRVKVGMPGK